MMWHATIIPLAFGSVSWLNSEETIMRKLLRTIALGASLAAFLAATPSVEAQLPYGSRPIGPALNPPYSPYLNLFRPGVPPYLNYYGLVRPQLDFRSSLLGVQSQVLSNQLGISDLQGTATQLATGHSSLFLNTSHYFLNRGGQVGGGRIAGQSGSTGLALPGSGQYGPSGASSGVSRPSTRGGR